MPQYPHVEQPHNATWRNRNDENHSPSRNLETVRRRRLVEWLHVLRRDIRQARIDQLSRQSPLIQTYTSPPIRGLSLPAAANNSHSHSVLHSQLHLIPISTCNREAFAIALDSCSQAGVVLRQRGGSHWATLGVHPPPPAFTHSRVC